jgi:thiol:disulfide interchange protein DsbD
MDIALSAQLSSHPLLGLSVAFGGGVLASLSPCLYPMIPVTLSIVTGNRSRHRGHRIGLVLVYVAGLASAYAALGLAAGLTGTIFGAVSTNPWLYFGMANVMLIAAAMMADVIPVPIPASVQQRAASLGTGGRVGGAFIMGSVSGLVAAPCGAPVLAAILTWVTRTGRATLGSIYLLAFSLGMCTLLLVLAIATDAALALPRPGAWMTLVKRLGALVLVGVAEYYLISMGQLIV